MDNAGNLGIWPSGDGDTFISVDPASRPPAPWWNGGYAHQRNVIILNNDSQSLPPGYAVHLHFDSSTTPTASELYAASQSVMKGDDFRIVYNNATEVQRYIQTITSDQIDIWFQLQAAMRAKSSERQHKLSALLRVQRR